MNQNNKNKNELKSKSDTVTVFNSDNSVLRITEKYKELVKNSLIAFKNAIELGEELQTVKVNLLNGLKKILHSFQREPPADILRFTKSKIFSERS